MPKIFCQDVATCESTTHIGDDCTFVMKDCPSQFRCEYIEGPTTLIGILKQTPIQKFNAVVFSKFEGPAMTNIIPDDFPRSMQEGAVPGAVPKYVARKSRDKFVVGLTEAEWQERYKACCTLAHEMTSYCEGKLHDNPSWSNQFLIDRTGLKIASEDWGYTDDEITWVLKRISAALKLEWEPGHWRQLEVTAAINGLARYTPG